MDSAWAERCLEEYLNLCLEIAARQPGLNGWDDQCSVINGQAELRLATVEKIVQAVYPQAPTPLMPPSYASANSEQYVRRALGALRDQSEVEERLKPESPVIVADRLHPRVWAAASLVWDTGEYRAAMQQATISLSAHIRSRSGSRLRDRKLVAQVFSHEPPKPDAPRLHLPGDSDDDAWLSRQQGLHLLAQGAFAGIRNVAAHEDDPWTEQEALELLAVLSTLARWTDLAELRVHATSTRVGSF